MIIGILGNGFIGKAFQQLSNKYINILVYDVEPKLCVPPNTNLTDLLACDIIFISVPTPKNKDGSVHLEIIQKVLNDLSKIKYKNDIIIRSTVPPGTCDNLKVNFMPEFLTEKNYKEDFINNKIWIFGLLEITNTELIKKITYIFNKSYEEKCIKFNRLEFIPNKEAELIKYFRNSFLSVKVSYCNEIYEYCQKKNINYNNMIKLAAADDRISTSHTEVPGPDGKFGFGGTCFPKDCNGLLYDMKKNNMKSYILESVLNRNNQKDRPEQDWENSIGRAVVKE